MENKMLNEAVIDGRIAELSEQANRIGFEIEREESLAARRNTTADVAELVAKLAAIQAEAAPLHAEYAARRWTRWYPCLNKNGHVHVTLACSSLEHSTRMGWATTLSGRDTASVVAEYGTDVCTVCVPEAPALPQPVYGSKAEQERAAARAEREAKRAVKAAKVAANTLVEPVKGTHGFSVRTVTEAKSELKHALGYALNLHGTGAGFRPGLHEDAVGSVARMREALVLKLGEEAVAAFMVKAEKAVRKEWRR